MNISPDEFALCRAVAIELLPSLRRTVAVGNDLSSSQIGILIEKSITESIAKVNTAVLIAQRSVSSGVGREEFDETISAISDISGILVLPFEEGPKTTSIPDSQLVTRATSCLLDIFLTPKSIPQLRSSSPSSSAPLDTDRLRSWLAALLLHRYKTQASSLSQTLVMHLNQEKRLIYSTALSTTVATEEKSLAKWLEAVDGLFFSIDTSGCGMFDVDTVNMLMLSLVAASARFAFTRGTNAMTMYGTQAAGIVSDPETGISTAGNLLNCILHQDLWSSQFHSDFIDSNQVPESDFLQEIGVITVPAWRQWLAFICSSMEKRFNFFYKTIGPLHKDELKSGDASRTLPQYYFDLVAEFQQYIELCWSVFRKEEQFSAAKSLDVDSTSTVETVPLNQLWSSCCEKAAAAAILNANTKKSTASVASEVIPTAVSSLAQRLLATALFNVGGGVFLSASSTAVGSHSRSLRENATRMLASATASSITPQLARILRLSEVEKSLTGGLDALSQERRMSVLSDIQNAPSSGMKTSVQAVAIAAGLAANAAFHASKLYWNQWPHVATKSLDAIIDALEHESRLNPPEQSIGSSIHAGHSRIMNNPYSKGESGIATFVGTQLCSLSSVLMQAREAGWRGEPLEKSASLALDRTLAHLSAYPPRPPKPTASTQVDSASSSPHSFQSSDFSARPRETHIRSPWDSLAQASPKNNRFHADSPSAGPRSLSPQTAMSRTSSQRHGSPNSQLRPSREQMQLRVSPYASPNNPLIAAHSSDSSPSRIPHRATSEYSNSDHQNTDASLNIAISEVPLSPRILQATETLSRFASDIPTLSIALFDSEDESSPVNSKSPRRQNRFEFATSPRHRTSQPDDHYTEGNLTVSVPNERRIQQKSTMDTTTYETAVELAVNVHKLNRSVSTSVSPIKCSPKSAASQASFSSIPTRNDLLSFDTFPTYTTMRRARNSIGAMDSTQPAQLRGSQISWKDHSSLRSPPTYSKHPMDASVHYLSENKHVLPNFYHTNQTGTIHDQSHFDPSNVTRSRVQVQVSPTSPPSLIPLRRHTHFHSTSDTMLSTVQYTISQADVQTASNTVHSPVLSVSFADSHPSQIRSVSSPISHSSRSTSSLSDYTPNPLLQTDSVLVTAMLQPNDVASAITLEENLPSLTHLAQPRESAKRESAMRKGRDMVYSVLQEAEAASAEASGKVISRFNKSRETRNSLSSIGSDETWTSTESMDHMPLNTSVLSAKFPEFLTHSRSHGPPPGAHRLSRPGEQRIQERRRRASMGSQTSFNPVLSPEIQSFERQENGTDIIGELIRKGDDSSTTVHSSTQDVEQSATVHNSETPGNSTSSGPRTMPVSPIVQGLSSLVHLLQLAIDRDSRSHSAKDDTLRSIPESVRMSAGPIQTQSQTVLDAPNSVVMTNPEQRPRDLSLLRSEFDRYLDDLLLLDNDDLPTQSERLERILREHTPNPLLQSQQIVDTATEEKVGSTSRNDKKEGKPQHRDSVVSLVTVISDCTASTIEVVEATIASPSESSLTKAKYNTSTPPLEGTDGVTQGQAIHNLDLENASSASSYYRKRRDMARLNIMNRLRSLRIEMKELEAKETQESTASDVTSELPSPLQKLLQQLSNASLNVAGSEVNGLTSSYLSALEVTRRNVDKLFDGGASSSSSTMENSVPPLQQNPIAASLHSAMVSEHPGSLSSAFHSPISTLTRSQLMSPSTGWGGQLDDSSSTSTLSQHNDVSSYHVPAGFFNSIQFSKGEVAKSQSHVKTVGSEPMARNNLQRSYRGRELFAEVLPSHAQAPISTAQHRRDSIDSSSEISVSRGQLDISATAYSDNLYASKGQIPVNSTSPRLMSDRTGGPSSTSYGYSSRFERRRQHREKSRLSSANSRAPSKNENWENRSYTQSMSSLHSFDDPIKRSELYSTHSIESGDESVGSFNAAEGFYVHPSMQKIASKILSPSQSHTTIPYDGKPSSLQSGPSVYDRLIEHSRAVAKELREARSQKIEEERAMDVYSMMRNASISESLAAKKSKNVRRSSKSSTSTSDIRLKTLLQEDSVSQPLSINLKKTATSIAKPDCGKWATLPAQDSITGLYSAADGKPMASQQIPTIRGAGKGSINKKE